MGRSLKSLVSLLTHQLWCRPPHFYRSDSLIVSSIPTKDLLLPGFNMGGAGRGYPFYDPISFQRQSQVCFNTVKKCLYIQNFNCSKFFLSIQSLNLLKVELKRLDFIQLASPPLVGSPNSHAQRLVEQRFGKSRLILTFSKTFPCRLGSSRRRRART